jgi:hypothetical protein
VYFDRQQKYLMEFHTRSEILESYSGQNHLLKEIKSRQLIKEQFSFDCCVYSNVHIKRAPLINFNR